MVSSEVKEVEPGLEYHSVHLDNGSVLKAYTVILGTGGSSHKLNIPGETEYYGQGVSYCAVCDGFFFRNKTVVVIGGGDSAAEESLYLAKLAKHVYMVHRRDALRASKILQQRIKAECKIEMIWNSIPVAIKANEQGVSSIELKDVKTGQHQDLTTDGVFIFVGFSPNKFRPSPQRGEVGRGEKLSRQPLALPMVPSRLEASERFPQTLHRVFSSLEIFRLHKQRVYLCDTFLLIRLCSSKTASG
jgi:thioredoxin reductase